MHAIDLFSDEAGDLMEEDYQHDAKVLSPRMHGMAKEKHKAISNQVCHCCFFFRKFCSCINVIL